MRSTEILLLATISLVLAAFHGQVGASLAPRVQFSQYPFVALIIATGSDSSIEYVCSGSILDAEPKIKSHILTSAFCIQDRTDTTGAPVRFQVLVPDPKGNLTLASTRFTAFDVEKKYMHQNASTIRNFAFTSKFPNGTDVALSVAIAPYDVGILRLATSLADVEGIRPVNLSKTIPKPGDPIVFAGYGGPEFFTLGATVGTQVLQSEEVSGTANLPNGKILFINDMRPNILPNETQAVEPGDEGSPMLDLQKNQVGIVTGSWQVNPNTTEVITFATLGPAIAPNVEFIQMILGEQRVYPTSASTPFVSFVALAFLSIALFF